MCDGVRLGGKTGTAQWGPKNRERTAAWFAGFVPIDKPRYAFAALYEGEADNRDVHGGTFAAPLIGRVMKEVFKDEPKKGKKGRKGDDDEDAAKGDMTKTDPDEDAPPPAPRVRSRPAAQPPQPATVVVPARRPLFPVRTNPH